MINNLNDKKKTNYSINTLVSLKDIFEGLPAPKKGKMSEKEKLIARRDKLLKDRNNHLNKADLIKEEVRLLNIKIMGMPTIRVDDRPDTLK